MPRPSQLESTAPVLRRSEASQGPTPWRAGARVHRYLLLEEVGRGSMGVVYRAYDPRLHREVALKRLRDGVPWDLQDRMLAEAQTMARLSHENVVAVYDVERIHQHVVVAMEFVPGSTLQTWCTSRPRRWPEIVEHFVAAGRGLAAAHRVGLLHRDFKPSNVLVGADGRVRVTDFGLAIGIGPPSVARSTLEDDPSRIDDERHETIEAEGTPAFMAPEQHRGAAIDARTDQYAFCVSLWWALTGRRPFEPDERGSWTTRKIEGPPAWPSDRRVPNEIVRALRRGLSPEASARFPSMSELLDRLRVRIGQRRARRAAVGAAVLCTSIGGMAAAHSRPAPCEGAAEHLVDTWDGPRRDAVHRAFAGSGLGFAEPTATAVVARLDAFADVWTHLHTQTCRATARGEQSGSMLDLRMTCLQRARRELGAVADVLAMADATVIPKAHQVVDGLPDLARCSDDELLRAEDPPPPEQRTAVEAAQARVAKVLALDRAGKFSQAHHELEGLPTAADELGYRPLLAEVAYAEASVLEGLGQYDPARSAYATSLMHALEARRWRTATTSAARSAVLVGHRLGRPSAGLAHADLALALAGHPEAGPREIASALNSRAVVLQLLGRNADAIDAYRRAIALWDLHERGSLPHARTLNNLGIALYASGELTRADEAYREALAIFERTLGSAHPMSGMVNGNRGLVQLAIGDIDGAIASQRAALANRVATLGPTHRAVAETLTNLGEALAKSGAYDEAHRHLTESLRLFQADTSAPPIAIAQVMSTIGELEGERGRPSESAAWHRRALAIREQHLGAHPYVAESHAALARALRAEGRSAEALAQMRSAVATFEAGPTPAPQSLAQALVGLGELELEHGRSETAASLLGRARASLAALPNDEVRPGLRGDVAWLAARVSVARGEPIEQARAAAETARAAYRDAGRYGEASLPAVEAWFATRK